MAYPDGFNYVSGPLRYVLSTVSSTATFKARVPVTLSNDRTLIEVASDTSEIFGIAHHDASDSIYPGKCLVEVPTDQTVYAVKVDTDVAASKLSIGEGYTLEKSGNYLRVNDASQASAFVVIVPRDDGSTVDSADSTVFVTILGKSIGVFGSHDSTGPFAQD